MVHINKEGKWIETSCNDLVFVIKPGAGTFYNRKAYQRLEEKFNVIYFGETGNKYDKYPHNWFNNSDVSSTGNHLGIISQFVKNTIIKDNLIPSVIIVGSRGSQVTIGKIWEEVWRGPTIMINAGSLTTNTRVPKEVIPYFITMGNDYFKSVNTPEKVLCLFNILKEDKYQIGYNIHLKNEYHMPNFKGNLETFILGVTNFCHGNRIDKNILDNICVI